MSPEERKAKLDKLAELEARLKATESEESIDAPPSQPALSPRTKEGAEPIVALSPAQEQIGQFDAVVTGAMQSIPFSKNIGAAVEAVRQVTSGETEASVDALSENYRRNKEIYDYSVQRVKDAYPLTHEMSDMGFSAIRGVYQPNSLVADITSGAIEGMGRSDNQDVRDALSGATTGFVFNRLGYGLGKAIGKVGSMAREFSQDSTRAAVGAATKAEMRVVNQHLLKTGQTIEDFSNNLYNQKLRFVGPTGGMSKEVPLFEVGQDFAETLDKVKVLKERSGKAIGSIVDGIDAKIDPSDIHRKLQESIVGPLASSDSPDHVVLAKNLSSYLENVFMEPTIVTKTVNGVPEMEISKVYKKDWDLRRLHNLKVDIADKVSKEFGKLSGGDEIANSAQKRQVVSQITDYMEDFVEANGKGKEDSVAAFKAWKKEFGNLQVAEDLLEKRVMEQNGGFLAQIQKSLKVRGLVVGLTSNLAGGLNPVASMGIAATINQMLESPAAPATAAVGLKRLADYIQSNPNSPLTQRVIIGAGQSLDTFRDSISSSIAEMELNDNPIKRSVSDVVNRQGTIGAVLQYHAPDAARKFRQLAAEGRDDELATFLSELSSDPRASKFIEPGMGIDGKAWTDADMKSAEENVRSWNPPAHIRLRMLEQLRSDRTIPSRDWIEAPPKQYEPRNKQAPKY